VRAVAPAARRPGARRRFLVTDGDTRPALAVTRSLGRAGNEVFVTSPRSPCLAGASRYCAGVLPQTRVDHGPEALVRSLLEADRQVRPDHVVGVTDYTLTALHASGSFVSRLPPPGAAAYFRASDKVELFEVCRRLGIRVPRGIVVAGGRAPDPGALSPLGTPFVVRPARSWRATTEGWVQGRVTIAQSEDELTERLRTDPALRYPYLVQEKMSGPGCGLFLNAAGGTITALFAHRRLREKPPWGGVSTLCESVAPSADLVAAATRYVEAEGWSGLAMFEFKRSDRDGEAYLLEINARPWGSMALARAAGVDFMASLLAALDRRAPGAAEPYREGLRLRWWWGDVDHFYLRQTAKGRGGVSAMVAALGQAVAAGPNAEAWDTFDRDDPNPFGVETLAWLRG
jgi:predicted ATP-grasp superfamily ATP-dependent carboligase